MTEKEPEKMASDSNAVPHIVLVDGSERDRIELAERIRAEGYRVTEANSGQEALNILAREAVDLLLTDLLLQDVNGWDLLDKVKEAFPYIHGVVATGSITEHGKAILESHKTDGYLIKPVQERPLQIILRALLSPGNLDRPADVVVVDIDEKTLQTIDTALAACGIFAKSFTSVHKAMLYIWSAPPDLVIAEVTIGEESGFTLCEEIRSTKKLPPIPIVLMSDYASNDMVSRAIDLRINSVLTKPLQVELLQERVLKILRRARLIPGTN